MSQEALVDLVKLALQDLNLVLLVLVIQLLFFVLLVQLGHIFLELGFLVVEFVLECEEMFIERNAVTK